MSEIRWLDSEEQVAWRSFIAARRLYRSAVEAPLFAETGISGTDYAVLVYLSEAPGREARMTELAEVAAVSSSQLVYRIDRLVERGLIERRRVAEDRRGSLAVMTDVGFAQMERAAELHVSLVRDAFLDRLSRSDFLTLGSLLGAIVEPRSE